MDRGRSTGDRDGIGPPLDRRLYASGLVTIGAFRAAVDHPRFTDSGPIGEAIFVFPRTAVVIEHDGAAPFTTDPCTVTFYNPGDRYTRRPVDPRGDACEWFAVRPDVLRDVLGHYDPVARQRPDRPFPFSHGDSDAGTYALQRQLVRAVERAAVSTAAVEEESVRILARIARRAYGDPAAGPGKRDGGGSARSLAMAARSYLIERFASSCSLDDVARTVGSSVFHLCRVFRRECGTTIHAYLNQLRLRRSLELVAERGSDLTRVALELGYSSHSHFTAAFRRAFGTTPSEFRRRPSTRRVRELAGHLPR